LVRCDLSQRFLLQLNVHWDWRRQAAAVESGVEPPHSKELIAPSISSAQSVPWWKPQINLRVLQ
jgi:hypothetical protein